MRERTIEQYLVKRVREAGGETRKLKWIGRTGAPDRVVFLNGVHFVELKSPVGRLSAAQLREFCRLGSLSNASFWLRRSIEDIDEFVKEISYVKRK